MAIELPELVQRVRVITTDMKRAEREAVDFGRSVAASLDDAADSGREMSAETDQAAESTRKLGAESKKATPEIDRMGESTRKVSAHVRQTRREAEAALPAYVLLGRSFEKTGRQGGLLGIAMGRLKIPAIVTGVNVAAGAVAGLGAGAFVAAGQVVSLAGALASTAAAGAAAFAPLAGALGAVPGTLLAIKSAAKGLDVLTKGPLEAASAIEKFGLNSDQAIKALKDLTPTARGFALELARGAHALTAIREAGQAAAFPGLSKALDEASGLLPILRTGVEQLGTSLGAVAVKAAKAFTGTQAQGDLGLIASRNAVLVETLGDAAIHVASALRAVIVAAGPLTQALAEMARNLAGTTDKMANSVEGQRRMAAFFERTRIQVGSLGRSLRDFGVGLGKALGIGARAVGDLSGGMENLAARFRAFVESSEGQSRIADYFRDSVGQTRAFLGMVKDLGEALHNTFAIASRAVGIDFVGGLAGAAEKMRFFTDSIAGKRTIAEFFIGAAPLIREVGLLLRDVGKAFLSLADNADVAELVGKIRTELLPSVIQLADGITKRLGPGLVDAATAFVKFASVLSNSPLITIVVGIARAAVAIADFVSRSQTLTTVVATVVALTVAFKALATAAVATGLSGLVAAIVASGTAAGAAGVGLTGLLAGLRGTALAADATAGAMYRLGASFRAASAAAKGFGILGAIITAATIAFSLFKLGQDDATEAVNDFNDAIREDNGLIGENTRLKAANRLETEGVFKKGAKFGLDPKTLTDAALGQAAAQAKVNAAMDEYIEKQKAAAIAGDKGKDVNGGKLRADLAYQLQQEASSDARGDRGDIRGSLGIVGTEIDDAIAAENRLENAMNGVGDSTDTAAKSTDAYANSLTEMGARAAGAVGSVTGAAAGIAVVDSSLLGLRRAFLAATEAADGIKGASLEEKEALNGMAAAAITAAQSIYAQTSATHGQEAAQADANRVLERSRTNLVRVAIAAGLSEEAARKYAERLLGIPPAKRTKIETPGLSKAIAATVTLYDELSSIPGLKRVAIVVTVTYQEIRESRTVEQALDEEGKQVAAANRAGGLTAIQARQRAAAANKREADAAAARARKARRDALNGIFDPPTTGSSGGGGGGGGLNDGGTSSAARRAAQEAEKGFLTQSGALNKAGRTLMRNFIDGLSSADPARVNRVLGKVRDMLKEGLTGKRETAALREFDANSRKLKELSKARASVIDDIKATRDRVLSEAKSARDSVTSAITGLGNVTEAGGPTTRVNTDTTTGETTVTQEEGTNILRIIGNLRKKVEIAKRYRDDLETLRKRKLHPDLYAQLVAAGPIGGAAAARELANSTKEQLREVNTLQGTLGRVASQVGSDTFAEMVKTGTAVAEGIIAGLRSQEDALEKQMVRLARIMKRSVTVTLDVRSPSRVMYDLFGQVVQGGINALADGEGAMAKQAAHLARATTGTIDEAFSHISLPVPGRAGLGTAIASAKPIEPSAAGLAGQAAAQNIRNWYQIENIEMNVHNPKKETAGESARDNLKRVGASLSR